MGFSSANASISLKSGHDHAQKAEGAAHGSID
jgi:hypothetical protein